MTEEKYTLEQLQEDFDNAPNLQGKHDVIIKAVSYHVEFGGEGFPEAIKEYKQQLIDLKKDYAKEEDEICNKAIEEDKYELYRCIKSYYNPSFSLQEGSRYYIRIEDPKSTLGEMWSEVGSDTIKSIIDNMTPIYWVITDNGIGTLKSRNQFKENFEEYFEQ